MTRLRQNAGLLTALGLFVLLYGFYNWLHPKGLTTELLVQNTTESLTLILVGMAKHKILAYVTLAEGVTNLLLSVLLVRRIGLIGVAWGTVIPHIISTAIIIPLYTLSILKMTWSDYVVRGFLRPVAAAIPAAGLCYTF